MTILTLTLITITITSSLQPFIAQQMIDIYFTPSPETQWSTDERVAGLIQYILLFLAVVIINWVTTSGQTFLLSWIGQKVVYDIRITLVDHLQQLSLRFFTEGTTGDIMSTITNDVEALGDVFIQMIPSSITGLLSIVGFCTIMLTWNLKLTLITLTTLLLFVIPVFLFRSRAAVIYLRTRRGIAAVTHRLEESVSGIRIIQSLTREAQTSREFTQANQKNLNANVSATFISAAFFTGIEIIIAITTSIVLWFGIQEVQTGAITIGILFGFTLYLMRVFEPISEIAAFYNEYQAAMASLDRIVELADAPIEVAEPEVPQELPLGKGMVEFRNVTFSYDRKVSVLKEINLKVNPNETVAIVGPTGAGKSSLIKLLSRFYDPQEGTITIDGYDIRTVSFISLRQIMGIVLQDTFLFPTTIRENIRYGKRDASDDEVEEAAKRVGVHDFIQRLPDGYDTEIQEDSSNISVGQRQLLSFARALLVDPRILILDEATSSVDPYTELVIQQGIDHLLQNRTAFIIAHRLSTVRRADRIIVLNQGEIVEDGTHDDLILKNGLYHQLYITQFAS
ncbi:MAG: ABC transporter ATP-binding protein [Candidatus Bathyarchaeota archaeon]|nr:MAG: ABC transporter ATP-binding protein [Candidatus Bathyarchaeota archaeon]